MDQSQLELGFWPFVVFTVLKMLALLAVAGPWWLPDPAAMPDVIAGLKFTRLHWLRILGGCVLAGLAVNHVERHALAAGRLERRAEHLDAARAVVLVRIAPALLRQEFRRGVCAGRRPDAHGRVCGVAGARAAGMRVLGYAGDADSDSAGLVAAGAKIFRDMAGLPALLGVTPS